MIKYTYTPEHGFVCYEVPDPQFFDPWAGSFDHYWNLGWVEVWPGQWVGFSSRGDDNG